MSLTTIRFQTCHELPPLSALPLWSENVYVYHFCLAKKSFLADENIVVFFGPPTLTHIVIGDGRFWGRPKLLAHPVILKDVGTKRIPFVPSARDRLDICKDQSGGDSTGFTYEGELIQARKSTKYLREDAWDLVGLVSCCSSSFMES